MSQHIQDTLTCDTHAKVKQAQKKLIKDSREIINSIKKHTTSVTRVGLTRSINHAYPSIPIPDHYVLNSYAYRVPTRYLLNAFYFTFSFSPNTNDKQLHNILYAIRTAIAKLGYKIAPIEQRLVFNQIYRYEARVHSFDYKRDSIQLRVDICDYAIRPCYQGGYLSFDVRVEGASSDIYAMVRKCTLQTLRMPLFNSKGYYDGYKEVPRSFYDEVTGITPPIIYNPNISEEQRQQMREAFLSRVSRTPKKQPTP